MTQQEQIIKCLQGRWVSPLQALHEAGTMKLSTRVGELRRSGFIILDKWHPSKAYKMYKLIRKPNVVIRPKV